MYRNIKTEITSTGNGFRIALLTDALAKPVHLSEGEGSFADTYFDLIPGRKV